MEVNRKTITLYLDERKRFVAEAVENGPGNVGLKILELPVGLPDGIAHRVWNPPDLDKGSGKFSTIAQAEAYARQWWEDSKYRLLG